MGASPQLPIVLRHYVPAVLLLFWYRSFSRDAENLAWPFRGIIADRRYSCSQQVSLLDYAEGDMRAEGDDICCKFDPGHENPAVGCFCAKGGNRKVQFPVPRSVVFDPDSYY